MFLLSCKNDKNISKPINGYNDYYSHMLMFGTIRSFYIEFPYMYPNTGTKYRSVKIETCIEHD